MLGILVALLALHGCLAENAVSWRFYPDFCDTSPNITLGRHLGQGSGKQCLLTERLHGRDCVNLKFENSRKHAPLGNFTLKTYVDPSQVYPYTDLNLTITDIKFHSEIKFNDHKAWCYSEIVNVTQSDDTIFILYSFCEQKTESYLWLQMLKVLSDIGQCSIGCNKASNYNFLSLGLSVRYQSIDNNSIVMCRKIELYDSVTELYVSHFVFGWNFMGKPYRLQYEVVGVNYSYTRQLIFTIPDKDDIDEKNVIAYKVFAYVDVTDLNNLSLYLQAAPKHLNVRGYRIWFILNGTQNSNTTDLTDDGRMQYVQNYFPKDYGIYYFEVAVIHPACGKNMCKNSTTPFIIIKKQPQGLLIMIVAVIWIPPLLGFALYRGYKVYRKRVLEKRSGKKPKCLLVYSPTHSAHVNVMINLTSYLRKCDINAMIDILDIPETPDKDPGVWCDMAFQKADIVIVATSPPPSDAVVPVIYRNIDNHILRLLKENFSKRNKRYLAIQFPYCMPDNIPREARNFKRLNMPEDLDKLVRTIYDVEFIRFFGVSSKAFLDSVKLAKVDILHEEPSIPKITEETDDLLPSIIRQGGGILDQEKSSDVNIAEMHVTDTHEGNVGSEFFQTNINDLFLLGDSGVGEGENVVFTPQLSNTEFRIDGLNL